MSEIEQFSDIEQQPCSTEHCLEHTGYVQAIRNIDDKLSAKLNVLIAIAGTLIVVVISFGGYLVTKTSAQAETITLIQERQRIVLEWKAETDRRMDFIEKNVKFNGGN